MTVSTDNVAAFTVRAAQLQTTSLSSTTNAPPPLLCHHESLTGNGLCLLVNWIGPNDLPVDGDAAVKLFLDAAPWQVAKARREELYRLDLLVRTPGD